MAMGNAIKFYDLKPRLKAHNLYEGESNVVVEDVKTKAQVVLPGSSRGILELLDGERTLKDISAELFQSQGQVSFNNIFTTIKLLKELDLLDGIEGFTFDMLRDEKSPHEQKESILNRALFEVKLLTKLEVSVKSDNAFFVLTGLLAASLGAGYFSFSTLDLSLFLKTGAIHADALLRLMAVVSVLMSAKTLVQGLLLIAATGRVYRPSLRVLPYAIALGVNDNSIYSHPKKAVIIAYGVASALTYVALAGAMALVPVLAPLAQDLMIVSLILSFIELNPYRRSDLTKLFYFFYADGQLKNITAHLKSCTLKGIWSDSDTKLADDVRYALYSGLALGWVVGFVLFSVDLILKSFPKIFATITLTQGSTAYQAMAVGALLVFMNAYLVIDLFHTIFNNILAPILAPVARLKRKPRAKAAVALEQDEVVELLRRHMLFSQLSEAALEALAGKASFHTGAKGDALALQGEFESDVFLLVEGQVDVTSQDPTGSVKTIATLNPGTLVGERSIVNRTKRKTSVVARDAIEYLRLPLAAVHALEGEFAFDFAKLRQRLEISEFVGTAELFTDMPAEVINLFVESGEMILFPKGHNLVDQGETDKTFFLLVKGHVDVLKNGAKVAELKQGDFLGEVALIANVPRTATIYTTEDSLFLCISDKAFWNILAENIELALYIENVGRRRMVAAA